MKVAVQTLALVAGLTVVGTLSAGPISFYGKTDGGIVTAMVEYEVDGNTVTVTIHNTSPTTADDGSLNAPAIVGFGFNAENSVALGSDPALQVDAFDLSGTSTDVTSYWEVQSPDRLAGSGGLVFEFVPQSSRGINGGLLNPEIDGTETFADGDGLNSDLFETTATFTITLDGDPGDLSDFYLRFQQVGINGEGSLTVPGTPIPEPATLALFGSGALASLALARRRNKRRAA